MRLIDADALMDMLGITDMDCNKCKWSNKGICTRGHAFEDACFAIEHTPTFEIEPERKKGKWIIKGEYIDCSVCGHEKWSRVPYENLVKRFNFCPNCGADMRGDQNDE